MHIVQVRFAWRNDLRTSDAPIKARLHHCASSNNSDSFETASFDCAAHFGDHINDGKRGYGFEGVDAEMSGNRCHADTFGRCRNKAVRESGVYGGLCGGVIPGQIAQERWRVGMHNGQLQHRVLPGELRNQSPVVKIRCTGADSSNKADMHFRQPPSPIILVERCSMYLEVDGRIASEWAAIRAEQRNNCRYT